MSHFNFTMNRDDIFEGGETLKNSIKQAYDTTRREYEMNKKPNASSEQLIYCKSLILCLKMYCCLFKNDYTGYSKYKNKYQNFENEQINNMLFNETESINTMIFYDEEIGTTTRINGKSEQLRLYSENVKDNIEYVELFSKLLFGKV